MSGFLFWREIGCGFTYYLSTSEYHKVVVLCWFFLFWQEIVFSVSYIWYLLYSGLHPKQGYRSPGTKKTYVECTKYVHRHTPAKASSRQPQTTNKRTMAEASGFLLPWHLIHFLAKSHVWDGEIHWEHLIQPPIDVKPTVQYSCAVVSVFGTGGK